MSLDTPPSPSSLLSALLAAMTPSLTLDALHARVLTDLLAVRDLLSLRHPFAMVALCAVLDDDNRREIRVAMAADSNTRHCNFMVTVNDPTDYLFYVALSMIDPDRLRPVLTGTTSATSTSTSTTKGAN